MLRFFFKPKWKHHNPVKRLRGVQELSGQIAEQHAILVEIATDDLDPRVRLKAVEKMCVLKCLKQLLESEPDDIVRSTAQNRYYSLLAGTASDCTPEIVTGRYKIVNDSKDEDLKKFIIHHSPDEKLQFTALQALIEVEDISRIAISAPNIKVREAATRMAEQMANRVESAPTPQPTAPTPETSSSESANDSIRNLASEAKKAKLRAEMKVRPKPQQGKNQQFISSGDSLQIDEDSADALQALLDSKLAARKNA